MAEAINEKNTKIIEQLEKQIKIKQGEIKFTTDNIDKINKSVERLNNDLGKLKKQQEDVERNIDTYNKIANTELDFSYSVKDGHSVIKKNDLYNSVEEFTFTQEFYDKEVENKINTGNKSAKNIQHLKERAAIQKLNREKFENFLNIFCTQTHSINGIKYKLKDCKNNEEILQLIEGYKEIENIFDDNGLGLKPTASANEKTIKSAVAIFIKNYQKNAKQKILNKVENERKIKALEEKINGIYEKNKFNGIKEQLEAKKKELENFTKQKRQYENRIKEIEEIKKNSISNGYLLQESELPVINDNDFFNKINDIKTKMDFKKSVKDSLNGFNTDFNKKGIFNKNDDDSKTMKVLKENFKGRIESFLNNKKQNFQVFSNKMKKVDYENKEQAKNVINGITKEKKELEEEIKNYISGQEKIFNNLKTLEENCKNDPELTDKILEAVKNIDNENIEEKMKEIKFLCRKKEVIKNLREAVKNFKQENLDKEIFDEGLKERYKKNINSVKQELENLVNEVSNIKYVSGGDNTIDSVVLGEKSAFSDMKKKFYEEMQNILQEQKKITQQKKIEEEQERIREEGRIEENKKIEELTPIYNQIVGDFKQTKDDLAKKQEKSKEFLQKFAGSDDNKKKELEGILKEVEDNKVEKEDYESTYIEEYKDKLTPYKEGEEIPTKNKKSIFIEIAIELLQDEKENMENYIKKIEEEEKKILDRIIKDKQNKNQEQLDKLNLLLQDKTTLSGEEKEEIQKQIQKLEDESKKIGDIKSISDLDGIDSNILNDQQDKELEQKVEKLQNKIKNKAEMDKQIEEEKNSYLKDIKNNILEKIEKYIGKDFFEEVDKIIKNDNGVALDDLKEKIYRKIQEKLQDAFIQTAIKKVEEVKKKYDQEVENLLKDKKEKKWHDDIKAGYEKQANEFIETLKTKDQINPDDLKDSNKIKELIDAQDGLLDMIDTSFKDMIQGLPKKIEEFESKDKLENDLQNKKKSFFVELSQSNLTDDEKKDLIEQINEANSIEEVDNIKKAIKKQSLIKELSQSNLTDDEKKDLVDKIKKTLSINDIDGIKKAQDVISKIIKSQHLSNDEKKSFIESIIQKSSPDEIDKVLEDAKKKVKSKQKLQMVDNFKNFIKEVERNKKQLLNETQKQEVKNEIEEGYKNILEEINKKKEEYENAKDDDIDNKKCRDDLGLIKSRRADIKVLENSFINKISNDDIGVNNKIKDDINIKKLSNNKGLNNKKPPLSGRSFSSLKSIKNIQKNIVDKNLKNNKIINNNNTMSNTNGNNTNEIDSIKKELLGIFSNKSSDINSIQTLDEAEKIIDEISVIQDFDQDFEVNNDNETTKSFNEKKNELENKKTELKAKLKDFLNNQNNQNGQTNTTLDNVKTSLKEFSDLLNEANKKRDEVEKSAVEYSYKIGEHLNGKDVIRIGGNIVEIENLVNRKDDDKNNKKGKNSVIANVKQELLKSFDKANSILKTNKINDDIKDQIEKAGSLADISGAYNSFNKQIRENAKKEFGKEFTNFKQLEKDSNIKSLDDEEKDKIYLNYNDGRLQVIPSNGNIIDFSSEELTENVLDKLQRLDKEGKLNNKSKNISLGELYSDAVKKVDILKKNDPSKHMNWDISDIQQWIRKSENGDIEYDLAEVLRGSKKIEKSIKDLKKGKNVKTTEDLSTIVKKEFNENIEKDIKSVNAIKKDQLKKFLDTFDDKNCQVVKYLKENFKGFFKDKDGKDAFANVKNNKQLMEAIDKMDSKQQYKLYGAIEVGFPHAFDTLDEIIKSNVKDSVERIKNSEEVLESVKELQNSQQEMLTNISNNFSKLVENRKTALEYYKETHPIEYFFLKLFTFGMGVPDCVEKIDKQAHQTLELYTKTCESYNEAVLEAMGEGGAVSTLKEQIKRHCEESKTINDKMNSMSKIDRIASNRRSDLQKEKIKKVDDIMTLKDTEKKKAISDVRDNEKGEENIFQIKSVLQAGSENFNSNVKNNSKGKEQTLMGI